MDSRLNPHFQAAVDAKKVPGIGAISLDKSGKVLYKGTFGTTNIDDPSAPPFTDETPLIIWSCTKLVTSVAALQLMEQGKLKLDDLVEKYVPKIKNLQVLDGFDDKGEPKYRAPKTKATILMLLTHTAGFSYDFFDGPSLQWRIWSKRPPASYLATGEYADVENPLIFDPGERYNYGCNTDWLGFVIEAITGQKLDQYLQTHILGPLGLTNTGAKHREGAQKLDVHFRGEDGKLTANAALDCAKTPDFHGGGHYLYSTLSDYSQFLLTILNRGQHPVSGTRILQNSTVKEFLFEDQITKICSQDGIGSIRSFIPQVSVDGEFLPGLKKGWSCGLLLNPEGSLKGRSPGSGMWAGLGNLYYWIDPQAGKLGMIATEILPFMDPAVLGLFDELERAVYGFESGEGGANFRSSL
jgi:methyl acetate hydrolase